MVQSRVTGLDISAFILAWIIPVLGFILGCVAISEAHKQGRNAHGLAVAAVTLSVIVTVIVIIVIVHVTASPSPTDQFIACQQGQINGTVPLTVDCSQYLN
jgi:uncharacterized Tic20 family protein